MTGTLRSHQKALEDLWNQGLNGHELLHCYTDIVDEFIIDHFKKAVEKYQPKGAVAVIALGGYGRKELYPFSDIDLLLLYDRKSKKKIKEIAEAVLYPLWDDGLDVGHSVRTVKEAVSFADEEYVFQVSLLDARFLAGSTSLLEELEKLYTKKVFEGHRDQFVATMDQLRAERRSKYGSHAYLLEPHIKEGKGGMRDIQAMLWVANGVFGLHDLDSIESSAMISHEDRVAFEKSWNTLARIRNRLHYLRRRKDDQLVFEFQEEMAGAFGHRDEHGMLAVEHFMRDVYTHLQTIAVITDLFFDHVHEILGMAEGSASEQQLEHSIVSRNNTVRLARAKDVEEKPYLLMRLFLQAGRTGFPVYHRTRKMVTSYLYLVDDRFRNSKRVGRIFLEIITKSKQVFSVLESMLVSGLLTRYIPEFQTIESLAQHDLYHIYTVDRHQMQTVAELHALREETPALFDELENPEILFLAGLLHDVGKGKQTDHSERGAAMVEVIGRRMQLSGEQIALLGFVVKYHLFMPENALRRDLADHNFILQTAETMGDVQSLTMLYLLSIADSKATGPSAWSTWKSSLLADFFLKVKTCLEANCNLEEYEHRGEEEGAEWLLEQVRKELEGQIEPAVELELLPGDYLTNFSTRSVARHLKVHNEQVKRLQQQILLFPERKQRAWSLLVMTKDRTGLLAKIFGVLTLHNLTVLSAQIFTWPDGTVVDVIEVNSILDKEFDEQNWEIVEQDCNKAINYRLDIGRQLQEKRQPYGLGTKPQVQQVQQKVVIDNEASQSYTIIEVQGSDVNHALYRLTQALADFHLSIHKAKVATEVELLIDVFYVTTESGEKVTDPELMESIRETLLEIIGFEGNKESLAA